MRVRHQYLLIAAAVWGPCLALAAGSYMIVLHPKVQYKKDLETKVAKAKQEYTRAFEAARGEARVRLSAEVERLQARTADFVVAVEQAPDLAFEISDLANTMCLEAFAMKPVGRRGRDTGADGGRIAEKRIDLSFDTTFPRFAAFLNSVERRRPVLFVDSFAITRPTEASSDPQVSMELAALVEVPRGE